MKAFGVAWGAAAISCGQLIFIGPALAARLDQKTLHEVDVLLNQGDASCVSAQGCADAIELYGKAVAMLDQSGKSVNLHALQEEGSNRYEELTFYLVRNSIIAYFQAGLYHSKSVAEKMEQLGRRLTELQEAGQDGSSDPVVQVLVGEMNRDANEAIPYLERTTERIIEVPGRYPWMKQSLDANVRFTEGWGGSGQMSPEGKIGFSDYYLGGAYLNLAWLAAVLDDQPAKIRWVGKLREIGQEGQLDQWKRGLSIELRQALSGHQL